MTPYEFRTVSNGKTIWTVERYCIDDADALHQAKQLNAFHEVQVWQSQSQIARVCADRPLKARIEGLRKQIDLCRNILEDGLCNEQAELCLVQIFELEDELTQLKLESRELH